MLRKALQIALLDIPARNLWAIADINATRGQLVEARDELLSAILIIPRRAEQRDIKALKGANRRAPVDFRNLRPAREPFPQGGELEIVFERIGAPRGRILQQIVAGEESDLHDFVRKMVGGDGLDPPPRSV